ncbi:sensor domain-containing diguanylate cyclase [Paraburkholderia sp. CNPSo 3274]|uniref:sensor domain-containing diguanylate cyclase n=1 Tax=Paraburkholderia sp. CNPSo 3274 TaxID=2940932 RepID=UPI0020B8FFF2|nr:sensor domain-containing diguanylate cyclase [Paraburkholderia sp. CNPSo 3274]MCP3713241.1 sensor domain-containing diguanylate cyclase [Paraburkholderia sp. CNPSo 3274]
MRRRLIPSLFRYVRSAAARMLSPTGVIVCGVFLSLFACGLSVWSLYDSRLDAYEHAEENARNLMLVIERDIARNVELYDLSLQAAADGVADPQVMALPPKIRSEVLFDRAASGKYLGSIFVMNERGDIILDSRFIRARVGNFADRDYFTFHRDHGNAGLYISRPYASRLRGGALTIALSRRITRANGSFGGVVVGTLSIDYFRALLDGLSVGEHGTAAVVETNGTMITRLPYDRDVVGRDIRNAPVFIQAMSTNEGAFTGTASIDGVRRLYVYRRLAGLPIIVDVAPAETDIYAGWQQRARRLAVLTAVFSAIIAAGSLVLSRELQRRQLAESRLTRLARTDALTGLCNRGTFDETLQKEWKRAHRTRRPLSLLFVDIDQFKAYNDYYGHQAGDEVLKTVAQCLGLCVRRPTDEVARYGGEEFVVTLPDTDPAGAMAMAETIRCAVYDLDIEHVQSQHGRVSVSIGVVTTQGRAGNDGTVLVKMADSALYEAKSGGRNRVCEAQRL